VNPLKIEKPHRNSALIRRRYELSFIFQSHVLYVDTGDTFWQCRAVPLPPFRVRLNLDK
jgi:hypothetical protein